MIPSTQLEKVSGGRATSVSGSSAFAIPRLDAADLQQVAAVLTSSGYAAAQELLQPQGPVPLESSEAALTTLRRLFWRGDLVSGRDAAQALAPGLAAELMEAGMLQGDANGVRARFQIQVYHGLFFIADFMPREQPADVVLPIGPSGKYLASTAIRRAVESALDLGCGCGVQALLISRHAQRVTATDINPRALALTRMNAAMNHIYNVETLEGSYYQPVAGRTFDLMVANLPYVITPENKYIYRDLGRPDDLPIRKSVEQAPAHLNEGGFAHLMLNWIHRAEQPWHQPIAEWTRRRNADAWLLYSNSQTPQEYTKQWLLIDEKENPEQYAQTRDEWLDWYEAQHIERVGFGLLTLRRRTSVDNWRCCLQVTKTANEPLGEHILHLFGNQDYLAGVRGPADLLNRRLKPRSMKVVRLQNGTWLARTTRAYLIRSAIGRWTARTISHLDGKRDLRAAIQRALIARMRGRGNDRDRIVEEMYQLINLGMIEPA